MLLRSGSDATPDFFYLNSTQKLTEITEGDQNLKTTFGYYRHAATNPRSGTNPLTYSDAKHDTHHGRLKWRQDSNGGWAIYDYSSSLASLNRVTKIVAPYGDTTLPGDIPSGSSQSGLRISTMSYAADWEGVNRLLAEQIDTADNQRVGHTKVQYTTATTPTPTPAPSGGHSLWIATARTYPSSATDDNDSAALTTITKVYEGANVSTWLRGLPYSVQQPDGAKQSMLYQRGTYDADSKVFTSGAGWAFRAVTLSGTTSATGATSVSDYNGATIDTLYLMPNRSTATIVIRNDQANVVRTETLLYTASGFVLIDWTDMTYDVAGNLIRREKLNGLLYEAVYTNVNGTSETFGSISFNNASGTRTGQKEYERDEQGLITKFFYDAKGRVNKTVRLAVAGVPALTTSFTYDASNRPLTTTIENSADSIVSSKTYNTAGQVLTETTQGRTTSNNYSVTDGILTSTTATLPGGATRVATSYRDGRPKAVTGSAAIAEYFHYGVSSGEEVTTKYAGTDSGARWARTYADWAGRTVKTETSSHNGTSAATLAVTSAYNNLGQLVRTQTTGLSPVAELYDTLGAKIESGTDFDDNGTLGTADRRTKTAYDIRHDTGVWTHYGADSTTWWSYTESLAFPDGDTTGKRVSQSWTRLTNFSAVHAPSGVTAPAISETVTADINGNRTVTQVFLDRASGTLTTAVWSPFATEPSRAVAVADRVISQTSSAGVTTSFTYDALGRVIKTTDRTSTGYSGNNTTYHSGTTDVATVTDNRGVRQHSYTYDSAGRVTRDETPHLDANGATSGYDSTYFAYNSRGQVTHTWGAVPNPVKYVYNDTTGDRTKQITYRSGSSWTQSDLATNGWPGGGDETTFEYYAENGLLKKRIDALTREVVHTYNIRGQSLTATASRGIVRHYSYYETAGAATGELKQVSYTGETAGQETPPVTYVYDRLGRMKNVTDATGDRMFVYRSSDLQLESEKFGRLDGSLTSHALGNTRQLNYLYASGTGRLSGHQLANGLLPDYTAGYGYNATTGRLASVTSDAGQFDYAYLANSNLVSTITSGTYQQARTYEANRDVLDTLVTDTAAGRVASYDYAADDLGRRRSVDQGGLLYRPYVAGSEIMRTLYGYNDRHELISAATKVGVSGSVNAAATLPGRGFGYTFDPIGNRTAEALDGVSLSYTANALNQYTGRATLSTVAISGVANRSGGAAVSVNSSALVSGDWRNDYFFKAVSKTSTGSAAWQSTTLSAANSSVSGSGTQTATVGAYTRPTSESFTYDLDGNLTDDALWRYVYDGENRLKAMYGKVADGSGLPALRFSYDYQGRRTIKEVWTYTGTVSSPTLTTPRNKTFYAYVDWKLVAEFEAVPGGAIGDLRRRFTWGGILGVSGGSLLAVQDLRAIIGGTYLAVRDGNGNITALTASGTGQMVAEYEYDPFGNVLRASGYYGAENPFRFAGEYHDRETGLAYYGFRYYSASLGRFINRDPIGETGGLNIYGFAGNDGINGWDVLGLAPGWWNTFLENFGGAIHANAEMNKISGRQIGESITQPVRDGHQMYVDSRVSGDGFWTATGYGVSMGLTRGTGMMGVVEFYSATPVVRDADGSLMIGEFDSVGGWILHGTTSTAQLATTATGLGSFGGRFLKVGASATETATARAAAEVSEAAHVVKAEKQVLTQVDQPTPVPIDNIGLRSVQRNAAESVSPTVGELRAAKLKDAHHIIQDAAVRDLPGYKRNAAPGVQLEGPANVPGTPHNATRAVQRQAGGGTYGIERRIGYKALRAAGYSEAEARAAIERADRYFESIGVTKETKTAIPGDRR